MFSNRAARAAALASALIAIPLRADVTLRYKHELKLNPSLPAQLVEQTMKGMQGALPEETVLQLKGGKGYAAFGPWRSISDFSRQESTLVDPDKKRYATLSASQLVDEMSKALSSMPEEARAAMAAIKFAVESKTTGRSAAVRGIQAEERELTLTIEGPPMPNLPPGPMVRLVMSFWTAKVEEFERVPALQELRTYNLWGYATMNPAAAMERMFQQMPGFGDGMTKLMQEMRAGNAVVLRTHMSMTMPALAAAMKQMPAEKNPFGAGFDAEAPFMEMNQELTELSTAAVPESVFQIPESYKSVSAAEILSDLMAQGRPRAKQ